MNCTINGTCSSTIRVLTAQVITLAGLFAGMLTAFLLPYLWATRRPEAFSSPRYNLVLSLSNCFSGGVFLATFFVGLMPEVREMFEEILQVQHASSPYPVTELVIFSGFFIALFIEQLAQRYHERKSLPNRKEGAKSPSRTSETKSKCSHSGSEDAEPNSSSYSGEEDFSDCDSVYLKRNREKRNDELATGQRSSECQHGHSHADVGALLQQEKGVRFVFLMLSLGVHSLFEGLALGLQTSTTALINLFVGVAVHELLVAFAMGISVSRLQLPTPSVIRFAVVFCLTIPCGQIIGLAVGSSQSTSGQTVSAVLQGLAAGTFIHVTFLEVIPTELQEKDHRMLKVLFLFFGFLVLLGCTVMLHTREGIVH